MYHQSIKVLRSFKSCCCQPSTTNLFDQVVQCLLLVPLGSIDQQVSGSMTHLLPHTSEFTFCIILICGPQLAHDDVLEWRPRIDGADRKSQWSLIIGSQQRCCTQTRYRHFFLFVLLLQLDIARFGPTASQHNHSLPQARSNISASLEPQL